jgi:hypothetical protein
MRMLIASLVVLTSPFTGLPGLTSTCRAAVATSAPASATHPTVQGRGKKRRPRPHKVKRTEKADKKQKKNDRGFEL